MDDAAGRASLRGMRRLLAKLRMNTRTQILVGMLISALIPSVFVNVYYSNWLNQNRVDDVRNLNASIVEQTANKIDTLLAQMNSTSRQLIASAISADTMQSYEDMSPANKLGVTNKYQKLLKDIDMSVIYNARIFLIGEDGMIYQGINKLDLDLVLEDMRSAVSGVPYYTEHFADLPRTLVVPYIVEIMNNAGYNLIKKIVIELRYSYLEDIFRDIYMSPGSEIFLVKGDDLLVYYAGEHAEQWEGKIGQRISKNANGQFTAIDNYDVFRYDIHGLDWHLIAYVDQNEIVSGMEITGPSLIVLMCCVLFSLIYSAVVSLGTTRPLKKLMEKMRHPENRQLMLVPVATANRDIQELSQTFHSMLAKIDELTDSMVRKNRENAMMQLKALQAQIDPHFLYNTLDVIRSLALKSGAVGVEEIARDLARMFRYKISQGGNFVTVNDEMEHVRNYVNIQRYRFGERIQVIYAVDNRILGCEIVKFILQPVIENAYLHGLCDEIGQGTITVVGQRIGEELVFRIIDSGAGMSPEKLNALREDLRLHNDLAKGVGLANVDARLRLYYGEQYAIAIDSVAGEGTQVTIRLPAEEERRV